MAEILAFHAVFGTHGSWLPNDPRGSKSTAVRASNLQPFGPATTTATRHSVAAVPHDRAVRRRAKQALVYPEVFFDDRQVASVGEGFAVMVAKSGYVIHACSILTQHIHLVVRRHAYSIEQVVRLLRQSATGQLLQDGLHPFADMRTPEGHLPSVWAQGLWKVFLYTEAEIPERVLYVEDNPLKEGKPAQHWPFVTPYVPV